MAQLKEAAAATRAAKVQKVMAPCGVEAWLVEDYAVPIVTLECAFRGGATQDAPGLDGSATMLAALLDEGAGPLESEAFHRALDDKAIELSFSADRDALSCHLRTLAANLDAAVDLLRLAVAEARLDAAPLERARAQILAGLRNEANDPDNLAGRAWREMAFAGHPYARPTRGSLESVPALTRADLVALRGRTLARDNACVAIVGALDAARAVALVEAVFAGLPAKSSLAPVAFAHAGGLGQTRIVDLDVPQSTMRFGAAGIARRDPDYLGGVVVNHILGGGVFSARLFREVREKRGLAYSIHTALATFEHGAIFSGGTSTKNERAAESLGVIRDEIAAMGADGPTAEELDKAKKYLTGSYGLRFDTSTKIAAQLVQLQLEGLDVDYMDRRNGLIEAVTLEDARRVARRLFGDPRMAVAIAGRPAGVAATG